MSRNLHKMCSVSGPQVAVVLASSRVTKSHLEPFIHRYTNFPGSYDELAAPGSCVLQKSNGDWTLDACHTALKPVICKRQRGELQSGEGDSQYSV